MLNVFMVYCYGMVMSYGSSCNLLAINAENQKCGIFEICEISPEWFR